MASFVFALSLVLIGGCSGSQYGPVPVSNVCNCHCGSQPTSEQNTDNKNCISNETLQASLEKLKNDLVQIISGSNKTTDDDPQNFDLQFPNGIMSDHVIVQNLARSLSAFTVSLWLKTSDTSIKDSGLLSYATRANTNSILFINTAKLRVGVIGKEDKTNLKLNDGKWHQVVFHWSSDSGAWQLYLDGILQKFGSRLRQGSEISQPGTLVLGQEQDSVGGGFDPTQSFIGLLSRVNIWDKVLSMEELSKLHKNPNPGFHGNVFKWDRSLVGAGIRGGVKVVRPSTCEPSQ